MTTVIYNQKLVELSPATAQVIVCPCEKEGKWIKEFKRFFPSINFEPKTKKAGSIKLVRAKEHNRIIIGTFGSGIEDNKKCLAKISKVKSLKSIAFPLLSTEFKEQLDKWASSHEKINVLVVDEEKPIPQNKPEKQVGLEFLEWVWKKVQENPWINDQEFIDQWDKEPENKVEANKEDKEPENKVEANKEDKEPENKVEANKEDKEPENKVEEEKEDKEPENKVEEEKEDKEPENKVEEEKEDKEPENKVEANKTYQNTTILEFLKDHTPKGWEKFFENMGNEEYTEEISNAISKKAQLGEEIFPPLEKVFSAFDWCSPKEMKVIIIGQDPYHTPGAAMGLCFSTPEDRPLQPSVKNIFKELEDDGFTPYWDCGDLTYWAQQGVFLINTALTVKKGEADSHGKKIWGDFTGQLFRYLNKECDHLVVIAWGSPAQKYAEHFDTKKHKKITSPHPSPFSAHKGFFGSKPFSRTNKQLEEWDVELIDWSLAE